MTYFITLLPAWGWLIISVLFYTAGEYISEKIIMAPSWEKVTLLVVLDALSILFWLPALYQKNNLAVTGTLWLIFALVATTVLGLAVFGQTISWRNGVGIMLAVVVVLLLS